MFEFADLPTTYRWAVALWLAALGGCIGSFLNVVVYRLPAGKSLVHPGSHCPKCGHAIRWYDNVPVFGWLALRGKCRDCHEPISFRYPLVEAITAALFFGLGWIELLSDGVNLPLLTVATPNKAAIFRHLRSDELIGIYAFHLVLLVTILSASLITYDLRRIPFRLFVPALVAGIAATWVWPQLHPMGEIGDSIIIPAWACGLVEIASGVVFGAATGAALAWLAPHREKGRGKVATFWTTLCIGLILGWQAVIVLGVVAALLGLAEWVIQPAMRERHVVGPVIWMTLLAPVWIVFWRPLAAVWYALGLG